MTCEPQNRENMTRNKLPAIRGEGHKKQPRPSEANKSG